jgi:hypothetical protein
MKRRSRKWTRWMCAVTAAWISLASVGVFAKEHGHGRDRDENGRGYRYSDHDREQIRDWYRGHRNHLPPGLARRDRLPPGLERQLRVRGTLPPGLRDRIRPCPEDLDRLLPPPPPDCERALIGGHLVLMNRRTFMVLAIFNFAL